MEYQKREVVNRQSQTSGKVLVKVNKLKKPVRSKNNKMMMQDCADGGSELFVVSKNLKKKQEQEQAIEQEDEEGGGEDEKAADEAKDGGVKEGDSVFEKIHNDV